MSNARIFKLLWGASAVLGVVSIAALTLSAYEMGGAHNASPTLAVFGCFMLVITCVIFAIGVYFADEANNDSLRARDNAATERAVEERAAHLLQLRAENAGKSPQAIEGIIAAAERGY